MKEPKQQSRDRQSPQPDGNSATGNSGARQLGGMRLWARHLRQNRSESRSDDRENNDRSA